MTSIPLASALDIIKDTLEQDTELPNRTISSASNGLELLGFCLNHTYFLFQSQFFDQTKGVTMGSPVSLIVANIYMEAFHHRAINTALNPTRIWRRYVDDTFVVISHTRRCFSHKSTQWILPSSSLWKELDLMVPYHLWIS